MRIRARNLLFFMLYMLPCIQTIAQAPCHTTFAKVLGSQFDNERGYSLAVSPTENFLYLGGLKNDSVAILKINPDGAIEWTRTFDFIPGRADHIKGFIIDSEGMIVGSGGTEAPNQGTSVFAFRYNPITHTMIWAHDFRSSFNNIGHSIMEIRPGGDFLMSNNPHTTTPNDLELIRLNRLTGHVEPSFSKHYHYGGSDNMGDFTFHNGSLYAAGRFTDGLTFAKMRITLFKIDPDTGDPIWTVLGHQPQSATARLYGSDLTIFQDTLYSIGLGDPDGIDITNTEVYIQKHTLDGELVWMNRYDMPGTNEWVDEIIAIADGLIILGHHRTAPSDLYLFKINPAGDVIWSRQFDFSDNDNTVNLGSLQSQLVVLDDHFYFTAYAERNGSADMILVKTDERGQISDTCFGTVDVVIPVIPVVNPVYYHIQINPMDFLPQRVPLSVIPGNVSQTQTTLICQETDSLTTIRNAIICQGQQEEGYGQTGQYIDHFTTAAGCDSMRVLNLVVQPNQLTTIDTTICQSQSFEAYSVTGIYVDTFTSTVGCDSIRILHLDVQAPDITLLSVSICPDSLFEGYGLTGIYMDTFASATGCDSIRMLNLTVGQEETTILIMEICSGQVFEGYSTTGIYADTLIALMGCDSIRILHLDVVHQLFSFPDISICPGDAYDGYTQSGLYTDTLVSTFGCDSIRQLTLTIHQPEIYIDMELCTGDSFDGYDTPGMYTDTLTSLPGECDTIRYLTLSFLPPPQTELTVSICKGQSYDGYILPGMYTDTLQTTAGCDSIRIVQLAVQPTPQTEITIPFCEGNAYGYSTPGTFMDTVVASLGCDTIRTIHIEGRTWYIPNVFSPNDDQINDVFEIYAFPDQDIGLKYFAIFDRFGDMVFETKVWPVRWDGRHKKSGRYFNPGVFAYVLITDCNQKQLEEHGNITLVR